MALTVTRENCNIGSKELITGTLTFDSSYATGGEAFNPLTIAGMRDPETVIVEPMDGYRFQYDHTNKKIKAYANKAVPPIVYDEHKVLDSSYQFATTYPAAFFINVAGLGENIKWRSTGITQTSLTAGECCLASAMAWGDVTTVTVSPVNQTTYGGIGDGTGWTAGTDWSFASNKAVKASGSSSGTLTLTTGGTPTIGHTYRIKFTMSSWASGDLSVKYGGTDASTTMGEDGTYTADIVAATTGVLTFTPGADTDDYTIDDVYIYDLDVYVHYITQGWKDVWDNLVQDEAITLATGANTLASGYKILALMYVDQTTATAARLIPIDEDDTVASGEVDVKFNSATAQLTVHSAQNGKAAKVTYLKVPSSGFLYDRKFTNEGATKAGSNPYTNTFDYPILIWGYSGCLPVNGGDTIYMLQYWDTAATGEFTVDWFTSGARSAALAPASGTACSLADNVTGTTAGAWGIIHEVPAITSQDCMCEVDNGLDLSGLGAIRYFVIGV